MTPSTENKPVNDPFIPKQPSADSDGNRIVIPVIAEQIHVDKHVVETGQVRITKTVREDQQTVDLPLSRETIEVERVAINQPVTAPPAVRQEGDTVIYPVLQEVIVKQLMLVEEIRVTTRRTIVNDPQQVTLRKEEVHVERMTPFSERPAPQNESSL